MTPMSTGQTPSGRKDRNRPDKRKWETTGARSIGDPNVRREQVWAWVPTEVKGSLIRDARAADTSLSDLVRQILCEHYGIED